MTSGRDTYRLKIREKLDKKLLKMHKSTIRKIEKKVADILKNPYRYKNLRTPLNHLKRVHIDNHFVLTFSVQGDTVTLEDYDHHDNIYKD